MSKYSAKLQEEELKLHVAEDWFASYDCKRRIGKIDFCVDIPATELGLYEATSALWAESKSGTSKDIHESFVQLILTIGRSKINQVERPPFFLGAFDAQKIAFLPYDAIIEVFTQNDFNWNVTPSDHATKEFVQLYGLVKSTIESQSLLFDYEADADELRKFIRGNFKTGQKDVSKIQITRNNFTHIYQKWRVEVMPSLDVGDWNALRKEGIIDADFFLADILSDKDNRTIRRKLFVLLQSDKYEVKYGKAQSGLDLVSNIGFNDGQKAHHRFWNRYNRPPRKDYWDFIIERRDLLVDQDIRERKGAFFTPQKWVALSQEYLAKALGDNWQDEYVILDCCCGTGNLEAGLTNKYNIWVCTLDKADVDVIHTRIRMMEEQRAGSSNLLDSHVFQFDFLNDSFDKFPLGLRDIVSDPEKRKKLVVYINPPYAEHSNRKVIVGTGENRTNVAKETAVYREFSQKVGTATRELYVQFFLRIARDLPGCILGTFSTLKFVCSQNCSKFRDWFMCESLGAFICPSYTFDNVSGAFPIAFSTWRIGGERKIEGLTADVVDEEGFCGGTREFKSSVNGMMISDWLRRFYDVSSSVAVGYMSLPGVSMQQRASLFITSKPTESDIRQHKVARITANNLVAMTMYLAVRHCIEPSWTNNKDEFCLPRADVFGDGSFVGNCLVFSIFDNAVKSADGPNHWIPYTEAEVNARDTFVSHFMSDFISGRGERPRSPAIAAQCELSLRGDCGHAGRVTLPDGPLAFSPAARAVLDAGRELWRYYHAQPKVNVNASFYDIRRHFQGVKTTAKGKEQMNTTSTDEKYTELLANLRKAMAALAKEIEPKVYEYGFLKR